LSTNEFEFDGKFYRQIKGCAMGTPCAPNYANLFMADLETKLLANAPGPIPFIWLRYIDDIFIIWTHSREELDAFLDYINHAHDSIKFTAEISAEKVSFLDVLVTKSTTGLQTQVYCKPTDAHLYLDFNSSHPGSTKRAIPYSQALRFRTICSTLELFDSQVTLLLEYFVARHYPRHIVVAAIARARAVPRERLLITTQKGSSQKVVSVTTFGCNNFPLHATILKYAPLIKSHPDTSHIYTAGFLAARRQTPNLRQILVQSRFHSTPRR
jgi:hypothetical protein